MIRSTVAVQLRERGHDVSAIAEHLDLVQLADEQVLAVAAVEERVVVTFDIVDFSVLADRWVSERRMHYGIVNLSSGAFRQDRGLVGSLVMSLDTAASAARLPGPGQTDFLNRPGA
jgi:hypothetical protein